jgi:hypothetical protein
MRVPAPATLAILATATLLGTGTARAQAYDPRYPVCLHNYGPVDYNDCSYMSLAQCAASASGRSAECVENPYFANARQGQPVESYRRYQRTY